jgi:hypothetical protein
MLEETTAGAVRSRITDALTLGDAASRLVKARALQNAILTSANFSIIAPDEKGISQLFKVGAERSQATAPARPHEVLHSLVRPHNHLSEGSHNAGNCSTRT